MTEQGLWTAWFSSALAPIIVGLIILNILVAWFALTQRTHRYKLEKDILAAKTFGNSSHLNLKRHVKEFSHSEANTLGTPLEDASLLKIDQAIKMLKKGAALEEIKLALDIEGSYLQIIAKHHCV